MIGRGDYFGLSSIPSGGKGLANSGVHLRLAECLFEWRIGKGFRVGRKEYGQGQWKQTGGGERWNSNSMAEGNAGMEGMWGKVSGKIRGNEEGWRER